MIVDVWLTLVQDAPRGGGGSTGLFILQMVAIGAIFYFLLIRPRSKQERAHRERLTQLQKGDKVVTAGGLTGRVLRIKDDVVLLKTGEATCEVIKDRITEIVGDTADKAAD